MLGNNARMRRIRPPFALDSPVSCNVSGGLVQPVSVSSKANHFDGGKPLRRVGSRITERRQLAHGHQNLNVTLREAEQSRRRRDI